jgi:two-component system, NarL family, sensor histidine kinase UhpB
LHAGLVTALRAFCEQFKRLHSIEITYSYDAELGHVAGEGALCLYRISHEALRNVARHADAGHVVVALSGTADSLQLLITDDGKGFDLAATRGKGSGLGLVSIDERVRLLGGSVHIETHPRGGTLMRVRIPQPHQSPQRHDAAVEAALS